MSYLNFLQILGIECDSITEATACAEPKPAIKLNGTRITSPDFPSSYPHNADTFSTISLASLGKRKKRNILPLRLTFDTFNIEDGGASCM